MSNNIPITARISKGLFGQKVSEPILNVGAAGVSGNNQTSNAPSPNKMMSSPAKQTSAGDIITGKNEPKNAVKVKTVTKGKDTIVKGKDTVVPGKKYVPNENAWWKSRTPEQKAAYNKSKREEIANDPDYQDKVVKGTDTVVKGKDEEGEKTLMVMNEGDALSTYGSRQAGRDVLQSNRKSKRADIDVAKAEAKLGHSTDSKGNKTTISDPKSHIKKAKLEAKLQQAKNNKTGLDSLSENARLKAAQSSAPGGKIKGTQLDYNKEQTYSATQATAANAPDRDANYKAMVGEGASTTEKKNPASDKNTIADAGSIATKEFKKPEVSTTSDVVELPGKEEDSAVTKKTNGFFNKKSQMKMKYFK